MFRGKSAEDGKWFTGQLLHFKSPVSEKELNIVVEGCEWDDSNEWFNIGRRAKVVPETIGQYTGLTDKNGKKIFEGDIVKHFNASDVGVDIGKVCWDDKYCQFYRTSNSGMYNYRVGADCSYEVIGNIYDNPELLKGGEEEWLNC